MLVEFLLEASGIATFYCEANFTNYKSAVGLDVSETVEGEFSGVGGGKGEVRGEVCKD